MTEKLKIAKIFFFKGEDPTHQTVCRGGGGGEGGMEGCFRLNWPTIEIKLNY